MMGIEDEWLADVSAFGEGEGDGGEETLVFLGRMGVDWWAGGIVEESARVASESEEMEGDVLRGTAGEGAAEAIGRDHTGGGRDDLAALVVGASLPGGAGHSEGPNWGPGV